MLMTGIVVGIVFIVAGACITLCGLYLKHVVKTDLNRSELYINKGELVALSGIVLGTWTPVILGILTFPLQ